MASADIIAKVRLYPTCEGGRDSGTPPDSLRCIFVYDGENFECRLLLTGSLIPGQEATVPIKFLRPELIKQTLRAGSCFSLRELRSIGEGIVESVC